MPELRVRTARRHDVESGRSLRQRRTWYADDKPEGDTPGQGNGEKPGKYTPTTLEDAMKVITALEKRVVERETDRDGWKNQYTELNQRMADLEKANKQKLEQEGNYQELARQRAAELELLKPFEERAKTLEAIIRESNEARVKELPEQIRSVVPVDYPPEKLQAWLNANLNLLTKPPAPDFDAGKGGGGIGKGASQPELTEQEKQFAQAAGMTFERYAELKKQKGQPIEIKKTGTGKE